MNMISLHSAKIKKIFEALFVAGRKMPEQRSDWLKNDPRAPRNFERDFFNQIFRALLEKFKFNFVQKGKFLEKQIFY